MKGHYLLWKWGISVGGVEMVVVSAAARCFLIVAIWLVVAGAQQKGRSRQLHPLVSRKFQKFKCIESVLSAINSAGCG